MHSMQQVCEVVGANLTASGVAHTFVLPGRLEALGRAKGAYVLMLKLNVDMFVEMPKRLIRKLRPGIYLYVGSACGGGGIAARLNRHFKRDKKRHWHIDQLSLAAQEMAAYAVTDEAECALVECLISSKVFQNVLPGFGSSDCTRCSSHLLSLREP